MIPVKWPDATAAALTYLRSAFPGKTFTRTRRDTALQVVVAAEWQQMETPISRRCTILLEVLKRGANGNADVAGAVDWASTVLEQLQHVPDGVVRFDQPIGPRVVTEPGEPKFEFVEASIVWVFSA